MADFDSDVIVIGGGLSGCIAARAIASQGFRVVVVDRAPAPRREFRAEQLVGRQIEQLNALNLLAPIIQNSIRTTTTYCGHRGAFIDQSAVAQYGVSYVAMVGGVRSALPPDSIIVAKADRIDTSATAQTVRLADGRSITARFVVIATGLFPQISHALGIGSRIISEAHSLCLGFDVTLSDAPAARALPLIYYGERAADRVDYLALFRIGDIIRANLFCYHSRNSEWTQRFVADPKSGLHAVMPGLAKLLGPVRVNSSVEARHNDIRIATNVVREGVVLIGDAFQTPCPSAGTGIDRILSDVEALARHLPGWFAGNRFGSDQIADYYDDAQKQAYDAECIRIARYRRAISTERTLYWGLHRLRMFSQRRMLAIVSSLRRWLPHGRGVTTDLT